MAPSSLCTRTKFWYSGLSNNARLRRRVVAAPVVRSMAFTTSSIGSCETSSVLKSSIAGSSVPSILMTDSESVSCRSRICDSSRKVTVSLPNSARSVAPQPSYCLS